MKIIFQRDNNFATALNSIYQKRSGEMDPKIEQIVKNIIKAVKQKGDKALFEFSKKYDDLVLTKRNIKISQNEIKNSYTKVSKKDIAALKKAASRIKSFHKRQAESSWKFKDNNGIVLGQIIKPIQSVGLYVPGGKASYPSSVLMNAIPARIAGVDNIVMCTPTPGNNINPYTLIAADIAGVNKIYRIGGAQAIAAMAFGSKSIPKVDKIVGPGNIFVATAKKLLFGTVDIDMIAGPSEIFIIADDSANPAYIASDLISQAEHDELAIPILTTTSKNLASKVLIELNAQADKSTRPEIIKKALNNNCKIFVVNSLREAMKIANDFAPEHLELAVKRPDQTLKSVENAGAVFLGHYTPEAVGDYAAGPNHVLPTGGTARFFSPLGVYDFYKRTSLISCGKYGLKKIAATVINIAEAEGLKAHADSVRIRLRNLK